jgi:transcriptional regulator with XRE-family HTH domain
MTTGGRTELGVDLDELRLLVGMSYRELARHTGCARSTLHDALTGRRFPRLDTVLAIARACGGDTMRWRLRWVDACKRGRSTTSNRTDDVSAVDQSQLTGVL